MGSLFKLVEKVFTAAMRQTVNLLFLIVSVVGTPKIGVFYIYSMCMWFG